jgi:transcriptional regulator with XRE-family HTH domain
MPAPYSTKQLTQVIHDARIAAGVSQKELATRAGLRQSHLTLIETSSIDPRVSTLLELGRALDLELVFVPRRVLPAVQSLTGAQPKREDNKRLPSVRGTPIRALRHIQSHLAALERVYPDNPEIAQAKRDTQTLLEAGEDLRFIHYRSLRRSVFWLARARTNHDSAKQFIVKAAAQLQELRQTLPQTAHFAQLPSPQPAAYELENEVS